MPWLCDRCRRPIASAADGVMEWITVLDGDALSARGLQLVHKKSASQLQNGCGYNEQAEYAVDRGTLSDIDLDYMASPDGLVRLLELLDDGELPRAEVFEVLMRLHLPNYEDAREFIEEAIGAGVFSPNARDGFYTQDQLLAVIEFARGRES